MYVLYIMHTLNTYCTVYPDGAVRLFEAASPREGFIAIHHNGSWGAVCNDWLDFDTIAAGVACRQLGYGSAISVLYGEWHGSGNAVIPRFFYNHFECTGSESSLIQCPHPEESPVTCTTNTFAGVKCGGEFGKQQLMSIQPLCLNGAYSIIVMVVVII